AQFPAVRSPRRRVVRRIRRTEVERVRGRRERVSGQDVGRSAELVIEVAPSLRETGAQRGVQGIPPAFIPEAEKQVFHGKSPDRIDRRSCSGRTGGWGFDSRDVPESECGDERRLKG